MYAVSTPVYIQCMQGEGGQIRKRNKKSITIIAPTFLCILIILGHSYILKGSISYILGILGYYEVV